MKKTLTPEQLSDIEAIVENQKSLGLISFAKEFYSGELNLDESKYIKVNLPESKAKFQSGNGEGIWACPVTTQDEAVCNNGNRGDTFDVYVLNDCITFPFACASIIKAMVTSNDTRPILDYNWMSEIVKNSTNGEVSFDEMLED